MSNMESLPAQSYDVKRVDTTGYARKQEQAVQDAEYDRWLEANIAAAGTAGKILVASEIESVV